MLKLHRVIWYGADRARHVDIVEAPSDLDAVAFALRRHPNALSAYVAR